MQTFKQTIKIIISRYVILSFAFIMTCVQLSNAQGTQASITGKVTDNRGETLPGATVVVRNESTGFSAAAATNINGEYSFRQLPLGSPYTVTATFIGFGEQSKTGYSLNQGDLLQVDFQMQESSITLEDVVVVANSLRQSVDRLGVSTAISQTDIQTLPSSGRDFSSLAQLSPLSQGGTSFAGQLASSTNFTIDGMSARGPLTGGTTSRSPYLLGAEAIREFNVITNDYDVTLGRSGGGTVSAVTKAGTNMFTGSAFIYHRGDRFVSQYDNRGEKREVAAFSTSQYGFTFGGPIIKDRLHYFVSWDHQTRTNPYYILDLRSPEDEIRSNITQSTLDDFLDIARTQYGVSNAQQTGEFERTRNTNSVLARFDYQINATNLLTVRNNFNHDINPNSVSDNTTHNLHETYGTHVTMDNSLLATLRSVLGLRTTNEASLQWMTNLDDGRTSDELPSQNIPRAIVERVASTTDDGTNRNTNIQIGGQRYLPETFKNNVINFKNNMYYNTDKINYVFGIDLMYTHLNSLATSEMNGRFLYNGIEAFRNNTPYRYVREIPVAGNLESVTVKQHVLNSAVYGQMQFKPFEGGEITAGLRLDHTAYFAKPEDNKLLTQEIGLRTDNSVNTFHVQPRVQFTWDVGNRKIDIIKIGGGIFGSHLNNYAMVNNLQFDGIKVLTVDTRDMANINPNFPLYRTDPSKVPGAELFDHLGAPVATFNINSDDVKVPTLYKMSASYNRFFSDKIRIGVAGYASFARNNYTYVDRNIEDTPFFRLANEGGRAVWVPVNTIPNNSTGPDWTEGRKSDKLGRVLELISEGKINSFNIVIDGTWRYFRDGQITASYTWTQSKANTTYNGNVANSAPMSHYVIDDPRDMSIMFHQDVSPHRIVVYGQSPTFYGFTVGVRYIASTGGRYSLLHGPNVNGDFNTNELAFVFDPNDPNTPQHIRDGINEILDDPETAPSLKTYIRDSFGKFAERNGGVNTDINGTVNVRVTKRLNVYKKHGFELSLDIFNVANLINREKGLTHGNLGNQTMYNLRGFDQVTQQYDYTVRPNLGRMNPGGSVWEMQLGLKYSF